MLTSSRQYSDMKLIIFSFYFLNVGYAQIADTPLSDKDFDLLDNLPMLCSTPSTLPSKSPSDVGATMLSDDDVKHRYIVDGPANLRKEPKGNILASFEDKIYVRAVATKGDWTYVRGYWKRYCESGWMHKRNLKPASINPKK
jgi:hypothetical protein